MSSFKSENEMHRDIYNFFSENIQCEDVRIESEVKGLFGVPDIILAEKIDGMINHVIAVELKLHSWQKALQQAFKYQSFAWESYVILDHKKLKPAAANLELFRKFNIGLGTYSVDGDFKILFRPTIRTPYSQNMFLKYCSYSGVNEHEAMKLVAKPSRKSGLGKAFQRLDNATC